MTEQRILTEYEQMIRDLVVERFGIPPNKRARSKPRASIAVDTGERAQRDGQQRSAQPDVGRNLR
jgi:hypothetical protein